MRFAHLVVEKWHLIVKNFSRMTKLHCQTLTCGAVQKETLRPSQNQATEIKFLLGLRETDFD